MHKEALQNLLSYPLKVLQKACRNETYPVGPVKMKPCSYHDWNKVQEDSDWVDYDLKQAFGGEDKHWIFTTQVELPQEAIGKELRCSIGTGATDIWNYSNPQFLVYLDEKIHCGLDVSHRVFNFPSDKKTTQLSLYTYASTERPDVFLSIELYKHKEQLEQFCIDLKLAWETAKLLEEDQPAYRKVSLACAQAVQALDLRDLDSSDFYQSLSIAHDILKSLLGNESDLTVNVVGHSHIDMAWLWTLDQTREKAVRSYATVLNLMDRYPEYIFSSSQPQMLEWLRHDQPALFEQIMARVKEGRWEIEGGMWIESDTILTSGESLVRQFLWGKSWLKDQVGVDSKILWLPDCFGFPATLPQIIAGCGIKYFVTTKLGWNRSNRIPHDLFKWKGLDGSEVLAFMVTSKDYEPPSNYPRKKSNETTYNGLLNPKQILGTWQRFQDKDQTTNTLHLYGYGDGGGGPTAGMLERQRRLSQGYPGVPRTKQTTVLDFLETIEKDMTKPATWVGELYLEYHRGTYTSITKTKQLNRLCENTAMETEALCSLAWLQGEKYPHQELEQIWKTILLNQFHDILPGSSIQAVYEESHRQMEGALEALKALGQKAKDALAKHIATKEEEFVVLNPVSAKRDAIVTVPAEPGYSIRKGNDQYPVSWHDGSQLHFLATELPSKGWDSYELVKETKEFDIPFEYKNGHLSTPYYEIELQNDFTITSLLDKSEGREIVPQGAKANTLQLFADYPEDYDAWNLGIQGKEQNWAIDNPGTINVRVCNPLFITLEIERTHLKSTYHQTITCYAHKRQIDFNVDIDWHEDHLILRSLFPTEILAPRASYQIAYGVCERTTHNNTSWDEAAFEVPAHAWVDLSEEGYGVALMSPHSYGYSAKEGLLSISLLRSPTYPYPKADRGRQKLSYSLLPHTGRYQEGQVVDAGYALHHKPMVLTNEQKKASLPSSLESFSLQESNVTCETLKKAEKRDSLILRLIETDGKRGPATVNSDYEILEAWECNLLEERIRQLEVSNNRVQLPLKARQITTIEILCNGISRT
ncbi:alpha-mannosidase [Spirochaeta cellobiosiphila]|uniref:alpha-mannosidase n=1 Tax=Spirochaeta cellobiosiphila TaxID=504483 RepID=UPI000422DB9C|nr:glycoside hydrolase family 38 C-terminal domain-containing protein [Spirochaeta cellobiosiphila]